MTIVLALMLVTNIALAGSIYFVSKTIENYYKELDLLKEYTKACGDLAKVTADEQDKILYRLSVAEERILNLTNKTGQMSVKLKKMDANTIYEVKDAE